VRTSQVEDLLTGDDHAAIGNPGYDGRHLAGRHSDHHFVEQRHALSRLSQGYERLPLAKVTERHQVMVFETIADPGRLFERGVCACEISRVQGLECGRHEEIPLLHTVGLGLL
jgi:hypothetical protein